MPVKPPPAPPVSQQRLREIAWEVGKLIQKPRRLGEIHFSFVNPRLGFLWWSLDESETNLSGGETLTLRIHDVTDILFDGANSHRFFDVRVEPGQATHYLHHAELGRHLLAEIGVRSPDGGFRSLARSNAVFFDRDRPAPEIRHDGMFVHREAGMTFPVENIFDAPVFEQLARQLPSAGDSAAGMKPLKVAAMRSTDAPAERVEIEERIDRALGKMGCHVSTHPIDGDQESSVDAPLPDWPTPPDLVHCHGWETAAPGLRAKRECKVRLVLHLHTTEQEWSTGGPAEAPEPGPEHITIARTADLIVVPHSSTRSILVEVYKVDPDRVVIVDEPAAAPAAPKIDPGAIKQRFHLHPAHPLILFCGEISHAAGADLLVDCLEHVCSEYPDAQFVFAGEGPLRGELEARVNHLGLGGRVRFIGDAPRPVFEDLLAACEYVALPARTWQGEGVAQAAIDAGKPVLTTHQAHLGCVRHGENGLIAYDNAGSITWGLKELLANPLGGSMSRETAAGQAGNSADVAAFELLVAYHRAMSLPPAGTGERGKNA